MCIYYSIHDIAFESMLPSIYPNKCQIIYPRTKNVCDL